jgi:hypothetical protein
MYGLLQKHAGCTGLHIQLKTRDAASFRTLPEHAISMSGCATVTDEAGSLSIGIVRHRFCCEQASISGPTGGCSEYVSDRGFSELESWSRSR